MVVKNVSFKNPDNGMKPTDNQIDQPGSNSANEVSDRSSTGPHNGMLLFQTSTSLKNPESKCLCKTTKQKNKKQKPETKSVVQKHKRTQSILVIKCVPNPISRDTTCFSYTSPERNLLHLLLSYRMLQYTNTSWLGIDSL